MDIQQVHRDADGRRAGIAQRGPSQLPQRGSASSLTGYRNLARRHGPHVDHPAIGGADDDVVAIRGSALRVPVEEGEQACDRRKDCYPPHRERSRDDREVRQRIGRTEHEGGHHRHGQDEDSGAEDTELPFPR